MGPHAAHLAATRDGAWLLLLLLLLYGSTAAAAAPARRVAANDPALSDMLIKALDGSAVTNVGTGIAISATTRSGVMNALEFELLLEEPLRIFGTSSSRSRRGLMRRLAADGKNHDVLIVVADSLGVDCFWIHGALYSFRVCYIVTPNEGTCCRASHHALGSLITPRLKGDQRTVHNPQRI